jgi:hypothetical protein
VTVDEAAPDSTKTKRVQESGINQPTVPVKKKMFEWSKLLDYTRKNHIALYLVLSNCGYEIKENNLNIYANNRFYKKKLDDPKYSALLSKCLQEVDGYELNIHKITTAKLRRLLLLWVEEKRSR